MLRIFGWTLAAAIAGAGLFFLGTAIFEEWIQPRLFPPKPGEGFNSLGFVLYFFGSPCGAVVGATAGLIWSLYRWKQPGRTPAKLFAYLLSFIAALGVLCLLLLITFRGEQVFWWLLLGGLTADTGVGAAACFWLASRPARIESAA